MNTKYNKKINRYKQYTVLVPCYNEEETIGTVMANMISLNPKRIVVVDDGSTDKSAKIVKRIQRFSPVPIILLQNLSRGGVGFALSRGFLYCLQVEAKYIVTVDADNQHTKEDVNKVLEKSLAQPENFIISGVRKFGEDIPLSKKFSNFCAAATFLVLYNITHPDPLCGLRVYKRSILSQLELESGYDWVVSVNKFIKDNPNVCSFVEIAAIYTPYSLAKGQNITSGVIMLERMVRNKVLELVTMLLRIRYSRTINNRVTIVSEKLIPDYELNVSTDSF